MIESLTISGSRAAADRRLKNYRHLLGVNLTLQAVLSLGTLIAPTMLADMVGITLNETVVPWARIWAGMVLFATVFECAGWRQPVFNRYPNVVGIAGRLGMAVLFASLGGDFVVLALFDGIFGLALAFTYHALLIGELMSRP